MQHRLCEKNYSMLVVKKDEKLVGEAAKKQYLAIAVVLNTNKIVFVKCRDEECPSSNIGAYKYN